MQFAALSAFLRTHFSFNSSDVRRSETWTVATSCTSQCILIEKKIKAHNSLMDIIFRSLISYNEYGLVPYPLQFLNDILHNFLPVV